MGTGAGADLIRGSATLRHPGASAHGDAALIWINGSTFRTDEPPPVSWEEVAMPVESLAVSIGVIAVFGVFSIALAWAYHQTNG